MQAWHFNGQQKHKYASGLFFLNTCIATSVSLYKQTIYHRCRNELLVWGVCMGACTPKFTVASDSTKHLRMIGGAMPPPPPPPPPPISMFTCIYIKQKIAKMFMCTAFCL